MNRASQLRTLLHRSTTRLYSSASGGGSKVFPTFLLLSGGTAAGVGGYYYYDPNAELFKQARSLIGVDNQAQPKPVVKSEATKSLQRTIKPVVVEEQKKVESPGSNKSTTPAPPPLPQQSKSETNVQKPTLQQEKPAAAPPPPKINPAAVPVVASTAAAALPGAVPSKSLVDGDNVPKQLLVTALRAQQEALVESHEAKLKVLQKEYGRKLENAQKVSEADRVVELRGKYEKASAALSAIEKGIEARADQNARAKRLRALWAQVNALHARVNHPEYHGSTITVIDKKSLQQAIEVPDKFVNQMLESLPNQPVHSLESLKQRFYNNLEPVAKNVSLIKEGEGFSLMKYACGKVLSWGTMDIHRKDPVATDKPLSTSQVLDLARGSLEKGDLLSAAVAVNKLNGLPRQVATDWLADARALLETNQTLFALMTYAASNNVF